MNMKYWIHILFDTSKNILVDIIKWLKTLVTLNILKVLVTFEFFESIT